MNRRPRVLVGLVAWACLAHAVVADGDETATADATSTTTAPTDVVATVGDTPIFRSELDEIVRRGLAAGAVPGSSGRDAAPAGGSDGAQWLEASAMEQIIDARLLRAEIEREQITIGRLDVDTRLDQLKKQMAARGLEWDRFLSLSGREEDVIREQIEMEIALDRLIRPKLTPTVLAAGFERHRRSLDGTRLRVSHVILRPNVALGEEGVVAALARAAMIRREIVQGTVTFADAAKRYSAGQSRLVGGDLGWISRDAPLIDVFAKQAFALAKGDVSKPFTTIFGIHVVQVTDIEPGRVGFEALRPKLEAILAETILRDLLARLRAETPVAFAAGVAHFDPATSSDPQAPRRVVVGAATATTAP